MNASKLMRFAILGATLTLVLAACGAGDDTSGGTTAAGGSAVPASGITIAMITHETPGDTYWDIIKAGANQAAAQHGIDLKYSSDPDFTKQATLVQNAIDSGVDGIAMTAAGPDALIDVVAAANAANIPVVMFDSGIDDYKRLGAEMYFGSDEYVAGQALGARIAELGGTNTLCVIHQEGSVALEARCKGVGEGVREREHAGQRDRRRFGQCLDRCQVAAGSVDRLDRDDGCAASRWWRSRRSATAGSSAQVATFDLNVAAAQAIKEGTIAMAVDAQPYLQGYEAVDSLWLFNTNGNDLGGGGAVLTGPSIVDASNIDKILPFAQNGTR